MTGRDSCVQENKHAVTEFGLSLKARNANSDNDHGSSESNASEDGLTGRITGGVSQILKNGSTFGNNFGKKSDVYKNGGNVSEWFRRMPTGSTQASAGDILPVTHERKSISRQDTSKSRDTNTRDRNTSSHQENKSRDNKSNHVTSNKSRDNTMRGHANVYGNSNLHSNNLHSSFQNKFAISSSRDRPREIVPGGASRQNSRQNMLQISGKKDKTRAGLCKRIVIRGWNCIRVFLRFDVLSQTFSNMNSVAAVIPVLSVAFSLWLTVQITGSTSFGLSVSAVVGFVWVVLTLVLLFDNWTQETHPFIRESSNESQNTIMEYTNMLSEKEDTLAQTKTKLIKFVILMLKKNFPKKIFG
jgi:hypothetical protein